MKFEGPQRFRKTAEEAHSLVKDILTREDEMRVISWDAMCRINGDTSVELVIGEESAASFDRLLAATLDSNDLSKKALGYVAATEIACKIDIQQIMNDKNSAQYFPGFDTVYLSPSAMVIYEFTKAGIIQMVPDTNPFEEAQNIMMLPQDVIRGMVAWDFGDGKVAEATRKEQLKYSIERKNHKGREAKEIYTIDDGTKQLDLPAELMLLVGDIIAEEMLPDPSGNKLYHGDEETRIALYKFKNRVGYRGLLTAVKNVCDTSFETQVPYKQVLINQGFFE